MPLYPKKATLGYLQPLISCTNTYIGPIAVLSIRLLSMGPKTFSNWRSRLPQGKRRLAFDDDETANVKKDSENVKNRGLNNSGPQNASNITKPTEIGKSSLRSESTNGNSQPSNSSGGRGSGGLATEVHPLLRDHAFVPSASKPNPKRHKPRDIFDPASLNPYLNQGDVVSQSHRPRPLQLNPKGKYVAQGEQLREKLEKERKEEEHRRQLAEKNLLPDESTAEELYQPHWPPLIEWWDRPYLQTRSYDDFKGSFCYDAKEAPVSRYIQHPVPVGIDKPEVKAALRLTKKELKRKRRIERQARHKEKQDRIRLGLDPPPPPKVKLSNLMNVLTNEAIKDPTGVEMKVRQQVEERYQQHMKANEERQLTSEQRHEKTRQQHERDLGRGVFTTVYKVASLANNQHQYKVDINAKQMDLRGVVLFNPRFCLVIVEGGEKGIKFYRRLMTHRIDWTQPPSEPEANPDSKPVSSDLQPFRNKCSIVWEGQLRQLSFQKWSRMYTQTDDEACSILSRFGLENYWREAAAMD